LIKRMIEPSELKCPNLAQKKDGQKVNKSSGVAS